MADDTTSQSPPKEGSNRGYDTGHQRANISGTLSVRHKGDSDNADDEPSDGAEDAETDEVEKEMEIAREHADPSKGDKVVDGGDRVSTVGGGNPQE